MSDIAFGSSAAFAFQESPAHARDDVVALLAPWALATTCLAVNWQWGWNPFNNQLLNGHSFDAEDKFLHQRRLVSSPTGETWDQSFTMDRITGEITETTPSYSAGWVGVPPAIGTAIVDATATHLLLDGFDEDSNLVWTLDIINSSPNAFALSGIRCAALLDLVNLDEYNPGDSIQVFYQIDPTLPDVKQVKKVATPRDGVGEFPYIDFHDLAQDMASYIYNTDFPFTTLPSEDYWLTLGISGVGFERDSAAVYMRKSKVIMHGDLCQTIRRRLWSDGAWHDVRTSTDEIIKCLPFAVADPENIDGSRIVRFNPPCRQGYYWWYIDAWPKNFTIVDGEIVTIPDYPTACDLASTSGTDPNCFTDPA